MALTYVQRVTLAGATARNFVEVHSDGPTDYATRICLNGDETGTGPHATIEEAWGAALTLVFAEYGQDPDLAGGVREYYGCDRCQRAVAADHRHVDDTE